MKVSIKSNENIKSLDWVKKCYDNAFGIILPTGWFGRPFDNQHFLKDVVVTDNSVKFVFDDVRSITIYEPKNYEIVKSNDSSILVFDSNSKVEFIFVPYGEEKTANLRTQIFDNDKGTKVELVGYFTS